jgi:hypothetical protein
MATKTKNNVAPALAMALAKSVGGKAADDARAQLAPGEYVIDSAVQLQGVLTVGEDTTKKPTSSILNQAFLALVLKYSGVTRESASALLQQVASEYLQGWTGEQADRDIAEGRRQQLVEDLGLDEQLASIAAMVADKLPPIPVRGSVKFKGTVNVLDPTAEQESDDVLAATGTEGK